MHPDDLCAPTATVYVDDRENAALSRDLTTALQNTLRARGVRWSADRSCAFLLSCGLDALSSQQGGSLFNSTLELGWAKRSGPIWTRST